MKAIRNKKDNTIDLLGLSQSQADRILKAIQYLSGTFPFADYNQFYNVVFPKPVVLFTPTPFQREANGRFKAKKWVARFLYPKNGVYTNIHEKREVVTGYPGKGKKPNLKAHGIYKTIQGHDNLRNEFRQFRLDKIVNGSLVWSREYV